LQVIVARAGRFQVGAAGLGILQIASLLE